MWFEPLQEIFKAKADELNENLRRISSQMGSVVQNTEAQLASGDRQYRSIPLEPAGEGEGEDAVVEYRNTDAYGWLIEDVSSTHICKIYRDIPSDPGFLARMSGSYERENVKWYIPPGSKLVIVHNNPEQAYVNMNLQAMVFSAKEGNTGKSGERIDLPRDPTTPSGHPLTL